jgi:hypothetical protein
LSEEAGFSRSRGLACSRELERRGKEVFPFLKLVVEFCDDFGKLMNIRGDTVVSRVKKIVDAVQESTHGNAC